MIRLRNDYNKLILVVKVPLNIRIIIQQRAKTAFKYRGDPFYSYFADHIDLSTNIHISFADVQFSAVKDFRKSLGNVAEERSIRNEFKEQSLIFC